jgi:hypothetical protein
MWNSGAPPLVPGSGLQDPRGELMRISRATIIALCIAGAACGGKNPPANPPDNKPDDNGTAGGSANAGFTVEMGAASDAPLVGMIRDAKTREPLSGVTVTVESAALQGVQTGITDERGLFALAGLPPGAYQLTAYYLDQTRSGKFDVAAGKTTRVTIDWDQSASSGEVVVIPEAPPDFKTALEALKRGALAQAVTLGQAELAKRPSSQLHATMALAKYGASLELFMVEARASDDAKASEVLRKAMTNLASGLDAVQGHLVAAAQDPAFTFELCVACMAGEGSYLLAVPPGALDVERDRSGQPLPDGDPRRRPTYRFDHGDLAWGRAIIHFQQALADVTLAYDWSWLDRIDDSDNPQPTVTIKLVDPDRIAKARGHLLAGLAASDEARTAFLAETDDDREWVPNPKQQSYASPLPVDAKLYQTWAEVIGDVRSLVEGKAGISLAGMWAVFGERDAPAGYIDLAAMLTTPKDITIEIDAIDRIENEKNAGKRKQQITALLQGVLGNGYKKKMKASKLTDRLIQLRKDFDTAETAFEDKLKYVLWLN